jgi:hypothetical protein
MNERYITYEICLSLAICVILLCFSIVISVEYGAGASMAASIAVDLEATLLESFVYIRHQDKQCSAIRLI